MLDQHDENERSADRSRSDTTFYIDNVMNQQYDSGEMRALETRINSLEQILQIVVNQLELVLEMKQNKSSETVGGDSSMGRVEGTLGPHRSRYRSDSCSSDKELRLLHSSCSDVRERQVTSSNVCERQITPDCIDVDCECEVVMARALRNTQKPIHAEVSQVRNTVPTSNVSTSSCTTDLEQIREVIRSELQVIAPSRPCLPQPQHSRSQYDNVRFDHPKFSHNDDRPRYSQYARRQNFRKACFVCGDKNHLKRNCPRL